MRLVLGCLLLLGSAAAGELQQLHARLHPVPEAASAQTLPSLVPGTALLPGFAPVVRPEHGIVEVGLERTRCYAGCPAYTLLIEADGTFRFEGVSGVERLGSHRGRVDPGRLGQVLAYLSESGFMDLDARYRAPFLDGPTTYTLVRTEDETKVVEHYALSGPATLWAAEELLEGLLETAIWEPGSR